MFWLSLVGLVGASKHKFHVGSKSRGRKTTFGAQKLQLNHFGTCSTEKQR